MIEHGTPGTVEYIARRMRALDAEEIYAVIPCDAEHLARMACAGPHCYVATDPAGVPICAFGVSEMWPRVWSVWMFATDEFDVRTGRAVKHHYQRHIIPDILARGATRAQCQSHGKHAIAHDFIRRMGGQRECDLPCFGSGGEDFVQFRWLLPQLRALSRRKARRRESAGVANAYVRDSRSPCTTYDSRKLETVR